MKKSFDVLYYIPRFYPAISGAEFYILNLAKQMHSDSQKVQILCSTSIDFKGIRSRDGLHINNSHPNYHSFMNIPIHRVIPDFTIDIQKFNQLLQGIDKFDKSSYKALLENGPVHTTFFLDLLKNKNSPRFTGNIIHSSYLPYATILYSLVFSQIMNIPSVCTPFLHMNNPRYQKTNYEIVLKNYDQIISCTETEKAYLINKGIPKNKIVTIPMGVDSHLYASSPRTRSGKVKSFKKAFNIKNPFVLFCGYKNFEKGAIALLHAAVETKKNLPDLMYVFIGPSTFAFDIELKKARQQGILVLNLTPDNLKGYYDWRKISAFQECEMYVMPSRSDAVWYFVFRSMASKKPVIGADTPVMREVIRHNMDGLLVEFGNIPQIAEAITVMFADKQKSKEMGLVGYSKIQKHNTWEVVFQRTKDVYDKVSNSK